MKRGDLVQIKSRQPIGAKGFRFFPADDLPYQMIWVETGIGVIIDSRDVFHRVLVHNTEIWFEHFSLKKL